MEADDNNLSPLDQIRALETAGRRRIAAARKEAETSVQEERFQAVAAVEAARESGQWDGQIQYEALLAEAHQEAEALLANAQRRAEAILNLKINKQGGNGEGWLEHSLQTIIDAVLERAHWMNHQ
jgi:vacuolar-type H+-ATPase subunit H